MNPLSPTVSIGLPVYNGENFIAEALGSLLAQTWTDFELIISDNASADATETICRQFAAKDGRIRYVRHDKNRGGAFNHAHVVEQARGRFFKWQAHDDRCHPEMLARCVAAHQASPVPLSLVYPRVELIDARGAVIGNDPTRLGTMAAWPVARLWHCLGNLRLGTPMYGLMPLDLLRRTRLIDGFISSDYVLFFELALLGRIQQLDRVLYQKRVHDARSMALSLAEQHAWHGGIGPAPKDHAATRRRLRLEYSRSIGRLCPRLPRALCLNLAVKAFFCSRAVRRQLARLRNFFWLRNLSRAEAAGPV